MKTSEAVPVQVEIGDIGCFVRFSAGPDGIVVEDSGGCPVEQILTGLQPDLDPQRLAVEILRLWTKDYDGDPVANGLRVEIFDRNGALLAEMRPWRTIDKNLIGRYRRIARQHNHDRGVLEIDKDAPVSARGSGGDGMYVQAWVWVSRYEVKEEL